MAELAITVLTQHGLALGQRIVQGLGHGEVVDVRASVREKLTELFQSGRPLVCVMALGIVVRILGPLTKDKQTDPAVVVVDEAGRFAISVLSGHAGGANELAEQVAKALGATAVITTASEALGLPAVDLIGKEWGWKIESDAHLKAVAAAVVRGDRIGVFQDAGRRDWYLKFGGWPASFQSVQSWPPAGEWAGLLAISDRELPGVILAPAVVYRPPTLVVGTGCRKGVWLPEFEVLFLKICQTLGLSPNSLGLVATADIKAEEPGLMQFAAHHGVPIRSFSLQELAGVEGLPSPSPKVRSKIGIDGVAEPATMLAAGTRSLLMPKCRTDRITMALARREDA